MTPLKKSRERWWLTVEPILLGVCLTKNLISPDVFHNWMKAQAGWFDQEVYHTSIRYQGYGHSKITQLLDSLRMMQTIMLFVVPPIIGILISPKLSTFRRKCFIIVPLIGQLCMWVLLAIFAKTRTGNPFLTILATSFAMLSGGMVATVASCLSYVTDVATKEKMALRFGQCAAAEIVSKLISAVLLVFLGSPESYYNENNPQYYFKLFLVCVIAVGCGLLYATFILPESINFNEKLKEKISQLKVLTVHTDAPNKPQEKKVVVFLTLILAVITSIFVSGVENEVWHDLRAGINWPLQESSALLASYCVMCGVWTTFGVWMFSVRMKIRDFFTIAIVCFTIALSGFGNLNHYELPDKIITLGIGTALFVPPVMYKSFVVSAVDKDKTATIVIRVAFCEALAATMGPTVYDAYTRFAKSGYNIHLSSNLIFTESFCILALILLSLIYRKSNTGREIRQCPPVYVQPMWKQDPRDIFSNCSLSVYTTTDEKKLLIPQKF